jgi:hypothetical protein
MRVLQGKTNVWSTNGSIVVGPDLHEIDQATKDNQAAEYDIAV